MQPKRRLLIVLLSVIGLLMNAQAVYGKTRNSKPVSLQVLHFQVGEVVFDMQRVEGGVFIMGGTKEQHHEAIASDLPTHTVILDTYYIGTTEVTQGLWKAVMPEWYISDEWNTPSMPITDVNWFDCQEFIRRLDSITGMSFRLPTEAEWEFAARGGNKSKGYRFSGGNIADSVSWGLNNSGFRTHSVGKRHANELGLYDMTGNVSEWCSDWYERYQIGTGPNPQGAKEGAWKVVRGGSFDNCQDNSHVSRREYYSPEAAMNYCGLRLALTLPKEPTEQVEEKQEMVKRLKTNNIRIQLLYVTGEKPYYISEEAVNKRIWHKVLGLNMDEDWSQAVVDKTDSEWNAFLEEIRKQSRKAVDFATEEEVNQAVAEGVTHKPKEKKQKQKHWEKNTRSIQRHRRNAAKAQKWADLVGVKIKTTEDPVLQQYTDKEKKSAPRWLVVRCK